MQGRTVGMNVARKRDTVPGAVHRACAAVRDGQAMAVTGTLEARASMSVSVMR